MTDDEIPDVPRTIAELPFFATGRFPKADTLARCHAGGATAVSSRELLDRIRDVSLGLAGLGLQPGERVALLSESRPEWLVVDFAIVTAGAVTTPIYPTVSVEHVRAILQDSGAALAIASTPDQLAKLRAAAADLPCLRFIVAIDQAGCSGASEARPAVLQLDDVAARGHRRILDGWGVAKEYHDAALRVRPDAPATLIYTSGTTGAPKGVVLTHANLASNIAGVCQVLELSHDDVALSFLPLSHAFERMVNYVYLARGVSIVFAESTETIARDLKAVRPTIMTAVPRVFEKLHGRIVERGRSLPGPRRQIFDWGLGVASRLGEVPHGKPPGPWLALQARLADALVFTKVREGVGGRLRFAVSGGAPLRADIARFFSGLGVPILEGYGLTESSPVLCVTPLERPRFGTVGPPLPNVEIRIAEDGEILARGPNIMPGYFQRPDDTAEAIRDGWLHTGDVGTMDADGYVRITDRKKDLLVTSGGKKIAPHGIETALKASGVIDEAMLIADRRHYPTALLVPAFGEISRRLNTSPPDGSSDAGAARAFVARPDVAALVRGAVEDVNRALAPFEQIKDFRLLERELTVAANELTPTLKVRRKIVEERYRALIESMYVTSKST